MPTVSSSATPIRRAFVIAALLAGPVAAQDRPLPARGAARFNLEVPNDPTARSTATLEATSLTITDGAGKAYVYVRVPKYDTPDGTFLGYYSRAANQTLRWPADNVGRFHIGDPQGVQFRESRMTVVPERVGRGPGNPIPPAPGNPLPRNPGRSAGPPPLPRPPGNPNDPLPRGQGDFDLRRLALNPVEIALLPGANDTLTAAYIDARGRLQLFQGWGDTWRKRPVPLRETLVPGAPLVLSADPQGGLPNVLTVGRRGELLLVTRGEQARTLTDRAAFAPGAHLVLGGDARTPSLIAADQRGSIQEIGLVDGQARFIEQNAGRYSPGAPLAALSGAFDPEIYAVDRQGTLLGYRLERGRWDGPDPISRGFSPGGHVAAALLPGAGGQSDLLVASVDAAGQLQVFRATQAGWNRFPLGQVALPPGAAVAIASAADGVHLSAVTRDGVWVEWFQDRGGLVPREIGRGFPPGAPVVLYPHDLHIHGLCVDAAGRLIAASFERDQWSSVLLVPEFDLAPRQVRRQIVQGEPLPPATVQFDNRHNEELLVRLIDELSPATPAEFNIPAGRSVSQKIKRDAPSVLEEVWLIPDGRGGWTEDVRRVTIPAPPRYRVIVYANRTTYSYVDKRKKPGPLKDFDLQSPVSLGSFRLPPGAEVEDGSAFDVYREAAIRQNPGAAAFDPVRPGP